MMVIWKEFKEDWETNRNNMYLAFLICISITVVTVYEYNCRQNNTLAYGPLLDVLHNYFGSDLGIRRIFC